MKLAPQSSWIEMFLPYLAPAQRRHGFPWNECLICLHRPLHYRARLCIPTRFLHALPLSPISSLPLAVAAPSHLPLRCSYWRHCAQSIVGIARRSTSVHVLFPPEPKIPQDTASHESTHRLWDHPCLPILEPKASQGQRPALRPRTSLRVYY
ncbi:hypothetical protein FB451DRAFT_1283103 [Mycena latifolia]|nr:hypothetical protein FB451DRAFT_1283103 [Mycena latifolia]